MHAVFQDQPFDSRLRPFGCPFRIAGDDLDPMIDAVNFDAAFGIDVVGRLAKCPVDDDAGRG